MSGQLGRVGYYGVLPSEQGEILQVLGITGSERSVVVHTTPYERYVTMEDSSATWPLTTIYRADLFTTADLLTKKGFEPLWVEELVMDLCDDYTTPQCALHAWLVINLIVAGHYTEDDALFCVGRVHDTDLVEDEIKHMTGIVERIIHESIS